MIVKAAIKVCRLLGEEDLIITGLRHSYIIDSLAKRGIWINNYNHVHGFMDEKDKFYTREEAYEHAVACGQIEDERGFGETYAVRLVSEDLW